MAKMTSLEYFEKFSKLDVFLYPQELDPKDIEAGYVPPGGLKPGWQPQLSAINYRNSTRSPKHYKDQFWRENIAKQFGKDKKKQIPVTVMTIDGVKEEVQLDHVKADYYYRMAFNGKASPELLQIAIQLVYRYRPVKFTLGEFVNADFIGTDCNGFVGGYYQRIVQGQSWRAARPSVDPGPDSFIETLYKLGKPVRSTEELDKAGTHVLARCREDGRIINNRDEDQTAPDRIAHIMLTVPDTIQASDAGTMTVEVVESTPRKMRQATYTIKEVQKNGVFRMITPAANILERLRVSRLKV